MAFVGFEHVSFLPGKIPLHICDVAFNTHLILVRSLVGKLERGILSQLNSLLGWIEEWYLESGFAVFTKKRVRPGIVRNHQGPCFAPPAISELQTRVSK